MDDDEGDVAPAAGMTISIRTRQDVVIVDPERFLATARRAYRASDPRVTEAEAEAITTVGGAVNALLDRYGALASDHPEVADGGTTMPRMHGGMGVLPGERVLNRPDGLSPAGTITKIVLGEPIPLQDYGCFLPEGRDLFADPAGEPGR